MLNLIKPLVLGAVLVLAAPVIFARDVSFLARPTGGSLPLLVLQAKAADFLPEGTNVVLKTDELNKEDVIKALKNRDVDFVTGFHVMGAQLYSNGMTYLQLAGVHAWGGVSILSKTSIAPGD